MLRNFKKLFFLIIIFFIPQIAAAYNVAITIDDLPTAGSLPRNVTNVDVAKKMLAAFKIHHIKHVYGFTNGLTANVKTHGSEVLNLWVNNNEWLANHTLSHMDLNTASVSDFIEEIQLNEPVLVEYMKNKNYKYFRYPNQSEGDTPEKQKAVKNFLLSHHYKIAYVSLDFRDYRWNEPFVRCVNKKDYQAMHWLEQSYLDEAMNALYLSHQLSKELFNRDINLILVLHFHWFEALMMNQLLSIYKNHGVKFISLEQALSDKAYTTWSEKHFRLSQKNFNEIEEHNRLLNKKLTAICR